MAKKQVLLVGVSDYKGKQNDLPGIDKDIKKMKKLFKNWGFEVKILYNKDSLNLESSLQNYGANLGKNDTFAFYYSGHGSHKKDENGDEDDGQDESLILSDGVKNIHFIDDEMNYYLNKIKAKKLLIFDSCHSGTVNKGVNGLVARTIPSNLVGGISSKAIRLRKKENYEGEYIVLSAAKDDEEALGNVDGGLFTAGVYQIFSKAKNSNKPFDSIIKEVSYDIASYCQKKDSEIYHPNISTSKSALKQISVRGFLVLDSQDVEIKEDNLQTKLDRLVRDGEKNKITIGNKKAKFKSDELVNFTIDTNAHDGYLTILYVDKNDVTVLYPNHKAKSKLINGKYNFPKDFGKLEIETYKNCKNCEKEKTSVYVLLTQKPFAQIEKKTKTKLLSFAKKSLEAEIMSKAVRIKNQSKQNSKKSQNLLIGKYEFLVY